METPSGKIACSKGGIGCDFDNFDRFVESQNGKNTLHDTVGISYELEFPEVNGISDAENNDKNTQQKTTYDSQTYQTTPGSEPVKSKTGTLEIDFSNQENLVSITEYGKAKVEVVEKGKNKKRRGTYEPSGLDVAPYRKKTKLNDPDIPLLDNPKRILTNLIKEKEAEAWKKDIIWITDIETDVENRPPMWVGWNSNLIPRDDETQKNWYLPRINMSPTSQSVVVETLKKITTYSSRM